MKLNNDHPNIKQKGFSLIEVLIALVIFSFALVGIASLMSLSMRGNQNGYVRSQANILSVDIINRMQANLGGVWEGEYNGLIQSGNTKCDLDTPCTPAELAALDKESWYDTLQQILPESTGQITCETPTLPAGVLNSGLWVAYPPFSGICIVSISWKEVNEQGVVDQNIEIRIQP